MSRAKQLLGIAHATYERGEVELAKDICALALADESFRAEYSDSRRASQERRFREALAAGDYDGAADELEAMQDSLDEAVDEEEAALSPGDAVPGPAIPELAPAQVANLVALARRIKADGHEDLAQRITKALGL
jgi:hypothetical protein